MPRHKGGLAAVGTKIDFSTVSEILVPYRRVSTREQAIKGAGLKAQLTTIKYGLRFRQQTALNWDCEDEGKSGKDLHRKGLTEALDFIHAGQAGGLIVAKLDRLSRSLLDFAHLMAQADKEGWNIVALDLGVDLSTPAGKMMAQILAVFAEFERNVIGQRTRDGLAEKRAEGVILGRPHMAKNLTPELLTAIIGAYHLEGGFSQAARFLNAAGTPTPTGGAIWYPATVERVVKSPDGQALMGQWEEAA
jgi:DNA invertase Pin-like site-specific DNA recombinase